MPLYKIQDCDRSLHVVAKDFGQAEKIWRKIIAKENEMPIEDVDPPLGIEFICRDLELILNGDNWESYCLIS